MSESAASSSKPPIPLRRRLFCLLALWLVAAVCISLSSPQDHLFTFFFSPILAFGAVMLPLSHVETPTLGMVLLGGIWFAALAVGLLSRWRAVFFASLGWHIVSLAFCVMRIPYIPLTTRF
jgi:hypothetical protein